jgi:hypothetical protein
MNDNDDPRDFLQCRECGQDRPRITHEAQVMLGCHRRYSAREQAMEACPGSYGPGLPVRQLQAP